MKYVEEKFLNQDLWFGKFEPNESFLSVHYSHFNYYGSIMFGTVTQRKMNYDSKANNINVFLLRVIR